MEGENVNWGMSMKKKGAETSVNKIKNGPNRADSEAYYKN